MTLEKIKNAITTLTPPEVIELACWFEDYQTDEMWDKQIAADCAARKFDSLIAEAKRDYDAGRCKPL